MILRTAADDLARVSLPGPEHTSRLGKRWEAILQQLLALKEKYFGEKKLTGGDALDEMSAFEQLVESLRRLEHRLTPEQFSPIDEAVAKRSPRQARVVRVLRERTEQALRDWREDLLARKAALAWPMNDSGLRVVRDIVASELDTSPYDRDALLTFRARLAGASAGDPVQMGDISETAERVLRLAVAVFESRLRKRAQTIDAVKPLSPDALDEAMRGARRADGSVDANLLAIALATDLGTAFSSTDRHLAVRRRQARFPAEGDDD